MMSHHHNPNGGYIALISGIMLSVSLLVMVTAVSFEGFFSRFTVFESEQKEVSKYLAEACVQTAIINTALNDDYHSITSFPVTIAVASANCTIVDVSVGTFPNDRVIRTQGIADKAYTNLLVVVDMSDPVNYHIDSWSEVSSHP